LLRELTLIVPANAAEPLSDALLAAGALSVAVEDAQADTADEAPLYGEPASGAHRPGQRPGAGRGRSGGGLRT
jgi:ribosomal protein L11 methyltransferase